MPIPVFAVMSAPGSMPGFGMGSPASSEGIRDQGSPTGSGVVCPTVSGVVEAESVMNATAKELPIWRVHLISIFTMLTSVTL